MIDNKDLHSVEERHAAMDKVAGFTYQFYCFLYCLLTMERGETVSFEKWDDAAVEKGNLVTMLQAKHTIKVGAEGKLPNLSDRAADLWKAIDVWRDLIVGGKDGNRTKGEMMDYIKSHDFVFVCNNLVHDKNFSQV